MVKPNSFLLITKTLYIHIAGILVIWSNLFSMKRSKPNAKYEKIKKRYFPRNGNGIKSELFGEKLVTLPKK